MRKQVELLKHHADVAAHRDDLLGIVGQLDAVDDDAAALPVLQPVDAAQQRRLPSPDGPQMTMRSPRATVRLMSRSA